MQMAAFPYQNYISYAPDFPYIPCVSPFGQSPPSAVLQQAGDLANTSSCFPCYDHHSDAANIGIFQEEISTVNAGTSSIGTTTPTPESSSSLESGTTASLGENKITSPSSSSVQGSEAASRTQYPSQKRRDAQRCASGSSANPNDAKDAKSKKPKKQSGATKEAEVPKASRQAPTGYIHVRARRGEATDSHSLAERVRREKIREKMKTLQDLVPGCDKVVGKALLLEEIINYVQSLQNQVQFLSMKLASTDPMSHDFGLGFADYLILPEELENISPGLPNVQGTSIHIQLAASADTANGHPVHDAPVPFLPRGEGPPASPFPRSTSIDSTVCELRPNYA